jgi:hypothetical protein
MKKLNKKNKQYLELIVIVILTIFSIVLWNTIVIYPIKLFTVLLHEISHGIAAILTGGKIVVLEINQDLSGQCTIDGGYHLIIASSGYIGSLIFGLLFIYSAYNLKKSKWFILFTISILLFFPILYSTNLLIKFFSFGIAILLLLVTYKFNNSLKKYFFIFLGMVSSFYVLIDIKNDLLTSSTLNSDAVIISNLISINPIFVGMTWFSISIVSIVFILRYGIKKGL